MAPICCNVKLQKLIGGLACIAGNNLDFWSTVAKFIASCSIDKTLTKSCIVFSIRIIHTEFAAFSITMGQFIRFAHESRPSQAKVCKR